MPRLLGLLPALLETSKAAAADDVTLRGDFGLTNPRDGRGVLSDFRTGLHVAGSPEVESLTRARALTVGSIMSSRSDFRTGLYSLTREVS